MIKFLESYNLDILEATYAKIMYYYADIGKDITTCKRPSFKPEFKHINPYYKRNELINMGINIGLIKPTNTYDDNKMNDLCNKIKKNDISASTIEEHHKYIMKSNNVGLIEYYSFQGSYFMNQYLRGMIYYDTKNIYLENIIKSMWSVINKAPAFEDKYILYRFVEDDEYLNHLDIGDEFVDLGFTSTTRDPFYNSESYKFGFILIKINIPKKKKGVALCMETVSHFAKEEEIILSPLSILRLDKKDDNCIYYHTDNNFATKINLTRKQNLLV